MKKKLYIVLFLCCSSLLWAQSTVESFFKPSDSLNKTRYKTLVITEVAIGTTALIGLNQIWHSDYPRSDFHFINDNAEWLQIDKAGHIFSAYHLGSFGANTLKWAGSNRKSQLVYGAAFGFVFLSTLEVLDGHSTIWGASLGDVAANAAGTALFVSQELLWKEQRIVPKFSFHTTPYASARPHVLGSSVPIQILKDYNGQTYWLSANIHSFAKTSKIPKWLNLAIGYGGEGMIDGDADFIDSTLLSERERYRQFYLSLDVDLTKINTKSHFVKTILTILNTIKIPAPTFEIKGSGKSKMHLIYF